MPQAFRSCRGILSLEKTFGQYRLVAACACASLMRVYGYQDVIDILNWGDDADFLPQADEDSMDNLSFPHHKNIRGREYFSKSTTNKKWKRIIKPHPLKDRNAVSLDLMNRMKLHGMASAFRKPTVHHCRVYEC